MSKKCVAFSKSKLGLETADNRKAFYAGWDAALAEQARHRRFTEETKVIEKMQQDEIIRMALESGFSYEPSTNNIVAVDGYSECRVRAGLERFAALVAVHERERCIAAIRTAHDEELCDAWDCIDVIKGLK